MTTALNTTYADAILKYLYADSVEDAINIKSPFLGQITKGQFKSTGGHGMVLPVRAGLGGGGSHSFTNAQSYAIPGTTKAFTITVKKDYVLKYIDGDALAQMQDDSVTFINGLTEVTTEGFNLARQRMQIEAFGNGSAALGQCTGSSVSTVYVTLNNKYDVHHFHVGMEVEAAGTATGSKRSGTATITGINYSSGILQTDTNWTSQITNFCTGSNDDYLYAVGDSADGGTVQGIAGLSSWLPVSASRLAAGGGDSHFGVDRGVASVLYGGYYDGSSYTSLREALIRAQTEFFSMGQQTLDTIILPPQAYRQLKLETDAKETITRPAVSSKGAVAGIGYAGLHLDGDSGPLAVFNDPYCPATAAFFLDIGTWEVVSAGGMCPRIINFKNGELLTVYNADRAELRIGGYWNLICHNPGLNARMLLKSYS